MSTSQTWKELMRQDIDTISATGKPVPRKRFNSCMRCCGYIGCHVMCCPCICWSLLWRLVCCPCVYVYMGKDLCGPNRCTNKTDRCFLNCKHVIEKDKRASINMSKVSAADIEEVFSYAYDKLCTTKQHLHMYRLFDFMLPYVNTMKKQDEVCLSTPMEMMDHLYIYYVAKN